MGWQRTCSPQPASALSPCPRRASWGWGRPRVAPSCQGAGCTDPAIHPRASNKSLLHRTANASSGGSRERPVSISFHWQPRLQTPDSRLTIVRSKRPLSWLGHDLVRGFGMSPVSMPVESVTDTAGALNAVVCDADRMLRCSLPRGCRVVSCIHLPWPPPTSITPNDIWVDVAPESNSALARS